MTNSNLYTKEAEASALLHIAKIQKVREEKLAKFQEHEKLVTDYELSSDRSICDGFFETGKADGVLKILKLLPPELEHIFDESRDYLPEEWINGRLRKLSSICLTLPS